jgi:hypothetical protein
MTISNNNTPSFNFKPTHQNFIQQALQANQQAATTSQAQATQQAASLFSPTGVIQSGAVQGSLGQHLVINNRFPQLKNDKFAQSQRTQEAVHKFASSPLADELLSLDPELANNQAFVNAWIDQPLDFMDEQI